MPDHLGYRKIFGVTGPSTNTIVQPDFDDLRPIGVTNHYSRIIIPNMPVNNNEDFLRLVKAIMGETLAAIDVLKSCEMQYLVRRFYQDSGFTVVRDVCLKRPSPVLIAHSTDEMCRKALRELDGDDVDAIVQVGTNLSMIRLAAAAELFLGKPVIAINTATYWHALRTCGIQDRMAGYGSLLEFH